jgi:cell division protein FtsB
MHAMRRPSSPDAMPPRAGLAILARRRAQRQRLRALLLLIATILLADALVGEQSLSEGVRARADYAASAAELAALRLQNARMRDDVRLLRDEPQTIEYLARKELGLARTGEILVVLK